MYPNCSNRQDSNFFYSAIDFYMPCNQPGPSCSKFNEVVRLRDVKVSILKYRYFLRENVGSFCKSYSHFCSKNIHVFENTIASAVSEFVINGLVKLTML